MKDTIKQKCTAYYKRLIELKVGKKQACKLHDNMVDTLHNLSIGDLHKADEIIYDSLKKYFNKLPILKIPKDIITFELDKDEKEKSANDIEASIPVSEFTEYWINETLKKSPLPDLSYESVKSNPHKGYFDIINELNEGSWIDECIPITKRNCEKLMSIKKSKTKEMKKKIIGYKFKDNDTFNKFCQFMITFYNTYWGNGYNTHWFNEKGYDIGLNNDITLGRLKKHNLLDDLFTPVYKEETELQSGKWYKTNELGTLWFINSIDDKGYGSGYGFVFGQWVRSNGIKLDKKRFKEASKEYVESMLTKEAKKRGLKQGVIANSMDGKETFRIKGKLFFNMQRNTLYCRLSDRYAPILENGIWIELKKEINYKTEFDTSCIYESKTKEIIQLYKEVVDNAVKNNLTTIDIQGVFKAIEVLILKKDQ